MSGVKGVILGAAGRLVQNALGRTRNYNVDEDDCGSCNKGESGVVVREDDDDNKGGGGSGGAWLDEHILFQLLC